MESTKLAYYAQRVEHSVQDLYDTVSSIRRIRIAKWIDIVLFLSGLALLVLLVQQVWGLPILLLPVAIFGYFLLHLGIKTILRGRSIGFFLMNLRFVSLKTKRPVSQLEYLHYLRKASKMQIRYSEILRYYLNYDGHLNQNQPMRRFGMVLVDSPKYRSFYKEYQYNVRQYEQLRNQQA
jgi:hypothetical protein